MTIQELIVLLFAILCGICFLGWLLGYNKKSKNNNSSYSRSDISDDVSDSFFDCDSSDSDGGDD